jgi:hypothetical protein
MRERRTSTPGDEERKQRILDDGLGCLRRLHGDQTWEDWIGAGAAMMIVTEEAIAEVGASRWDKDNKRLVREFNRCWEEYEARLSSNYKPLSKQERWALREVMTNPEIGIWRGQLNGPQKRKLNHPNAVVNRWKASTQPHPREKRQPSPALSPALAERDRKIAELEARKGVIDPATLAQELAQAKVQLAQARARISELEARGEQPEAGADAAHREAEIAALKDENYKFRVELEARNYVIKTRNGGGLTRAQFRMLQQCCHPDNSASKETREKAIRLINQLGYVLCNEAELPSMDPQKFSTWARQLWVRRQQGIKEVKKYAKRRGQPKPSPRSPKNLPKT